jgi:hypothetical protein
MTGNGARRRLGQVTDGLNWTRWGTFDSCETVPAQSGRVLSLIMRTVSAALSDCTRAACWEISQVNPVFVKRVSGLSRNYPLLIPGAWTTLRDWRKVAAFWDHAQPKASR